MAGTRLRLVTTPSQFAATVQFLVAPKADKILTKAKPAIQNRISNLLRTAIEGSLTIQSLKGGQLQVDFGLTDGAADAATRDIVNAVVSAVNVFFQKSFLFNIYATGSFFFLLSSNSFCLFSYCSIVAPEKYSNQHSAQ